MTSSVVLRFSRTRTATTKETFVTLAVTTTAVTTAAVTSTAATIVSATTLAVTTENALTDLTTLTTMIGGACTESARKNMSLQHNLYGQLGFTGCSFRQLRCDDYGCAVFRHPSQLHHLGSASAVFGGNGWHVGWNFDDKIDLVGSEGLEGMKVDNIKPKRCVEWSEKLGSSRVRRRTSRGCRGLNHEESGDASEEPGFAWLMLGISDCRRSLR